MADEPERTGAADEFYVGYLSMPPGLGRFLRWLVPALVLMVAVIAGLIAASQKDPGRGAWDPDRTLEFEGIVWAHPYPLLHVSNSSAVPDVRTLLLVAEGKIGAADRVEGLDGKRVRVRGTLLHRDGCHVLELVNDPKAVQQAGSAGPEPFQQSNSSRTARVTLRGEIIDPKCFSGAMKPGGGKAHKACATLCIRGGIPPMLVTWDAGGKAAYYVLVDRDGGPLTGRALDAVIPFVGDAVEVAGDIAWLDDVRMLKINLASLRRL